jgi:phosphoribosylaminoimidazole (AIR) synthetase
MFNIFNMGIGMVLAVNPEDAEKAADGAVVLGKVTENEGVHFE